MSGLTRRSDRRAERLKRQSRKGTARSEDRQKPSPPTAKNRQIL